jgi:hypothetical protein
MHIVCKRPNTFDKSALSIAASNTHSCIAEDEEDDEDDDEDEEDDDDDDNDDNDTLDIFFLKHSKSTMHSTSINSSQSSRKIRRERWMPPFNVTVLHTCEAKTNSTATPPLNVPVLHSVRADDVHSVHRLTEQTWCHRQAPWIVAAAAAGRYIVDRVLAQALAAAAAAAFALVDTAGVALADDKSLAAEANAWRHSRHLSAAARRAHSAWHHCDRRARIVRRAAETDGTRRHRTRVHGTRHESIPHERENLAPVHGHDIHHHHDIPAHRHARWQWPK